MRTVIYQIDVEIVAPVNPTEDLTRVIDAITNIFPNATVTESVGELIASTHSIDRFVELLEKQRIRETARTTLHDQVVDDTITFAISKQAALEEVVNFALAQPAELGDIVVSIRVEQPDPHQLIEQLLRPEDD